MIILICSFNTKSTPSITCREYLTAIGAEVAFEEILARGDADYVSIRIIREEKCPPTK